MEGARTIPGATAIVLRVASRRLTRHTTRHTTQMNEPVPFGRWVKRLRAEVDLTQERLGKQVGCAAQTIRSFESGIRRPSRELADRMADALEVPPEQRTGFVRLARIPLAASPADLYDHADPDRAP